MGKAGLLACLEEQLRAAPAASEEEQESVPWIPAESQEVALVVTRPPERLAVVALAPLWLLPDQTPQMWLCSHALFSASSRAIALDNREKFL